MKYFLIVFLIYPVIVFSEMQIFPMYKVIVEKGSGLIAYENPNIQKKISEIYDYDDRINVYECKLIDKEKYCQTDKGWVEGNYLKIETYQEAFNRQIRAFPIDFTTNEIQKYDKKYWKEEDYVYLPWKSQDILNEMSKIKKILYSVYFEKENEIFLNDIIEIRIENVGKDFFAYNIFSQKKEKYINKRKIYRRKNNEVFFSPFFPELKFFKVGVMRFFDNVDACSHEDYTYINTESGIFVSIGFEGVTDKNDFARIWLIESLPGVASRFEDISNKKVFILNKIIFKNHDKIYGEYAEYNSTVPWSPCPVIRQCRSEKQCPIEKKVYRSNKKINGKFFYFSYIYSDFGDGCGLETYYNYSKKSFLYPIEVNMNRKEFFDGDCEKEIIQIGRNLKVDLKNTNELILFKKGKKIKLYLQKDKLIGESPKL